MADNKQPAPPRAFTGSDYYKLSQAIDKLHETQMGALMDPFTTDELMLLFCPYEYRKAFKLVYALEETSRAKGTIFVDLIGTRLFLVDKLEVFPDDTTARSHIKKAVMRLYFHRDFAPEGFITPMPIFGSLDAPIKRLQECPETLLHRFAQQAQQLLYTNCEWAFVRWVLEGLQNSVRTPQQVRYVWPAIQTLAKVAELEKMDLRQPSVRAGMNAAPDVKIAPYLRATNDVVANAVLLGVNDTYRDRFKRGDIKIASSTFSTTSNGINLTTTASV